MGETINMDQYDPAMDNLEEYVNRQGYTLGDKADALQKLAFSIEYCYVNGVITESQCRQANQKFSRMFEKALMKNKDVI